MAQIHLCWEPPGRPVCLATSANIFICLELLTSTHIMDVPYLSKTWRYKQFRWSFLSLVEKETLVHYHFWNMLYSRRKCFVLPFPLPLIKNQSLWQYIIGASAMFSYYRDNPKLNPARSTCFFFRMLQVEKEINRQLLGQDLDMYVWLEFT